MSEVKTGSTVKARYNYSATGQKLGVKDANGQNGFDYLGSLTLEKTNGFLSVECNFAEGMIKGSTVTYFDRDHLGSVRATVNQNGTVAGINDYYAFGTRHNTGLIDQANRFLFNGKENQVIGELRLIDFGWRMNDTELGRWFNLDKLAEKYFALSPFNYCANNPVIFVDPDGKDLVIHYKSSSGKNATYTFKGEKQVSSDNRFVNQVVEAYHYNVGNGGGEAMQAAATDPSVQVKVIQDDKSAIRWDNAVKWNPELGRMTSNEDVLSPATLLEHEVDHAYNALTDPEGHKNRKNDKSQEDVWTNAEEKRVIQGNESKTARANGEIGNRNHSRDTHKASGPHVYGVIVKGGPTSIEIDENKTKGYNENKGHYR